MTNPLPEEALSTTAWCLETIANNKGEENSQVDDVKLFRQFCHSQLLDWLKTKKKPSTSPWMDH
ncbi:hypothetical protein PCC7424_5129 [Gloeothece citriformis PCC 7424]|uniref:Uncharacterized protein n=1 Tax=Gloeothece citriformis (strain PCC 7424) TaxID=65393 RepID=B7KGZ2_GLOC7|nr:hypothetical protein [Gloeothece citriformis]ACK73479.1 hypothetical protein PCC7424_5129 [Gloeothece citriformis PCC 7424]